MSNKMWSQPYTPARSLNPSQNYSNPNNANKSDDFWGGLTKTPPAVYAGVGVSLAIGAVIIGGVALTASAPVSVPVVLTSVTLLTALGVGGMFAQYGVEEFFKKPNENPQNPSTKSSKNANCL